jgi:outer membrane protein
MRGILLWLMVLTTATLKAQMPWSFEKCLQQALSQNIDLQLSQLGIESAEWQWRQAKHAQLPSASLSAGQFYQSGRSIDRFTNQFVQSTISSNNFQAQGSVTLFAGRQLQEQKSSSYTNLQSSKENQRAAEQALALNVATAYLQCLQTQARWKAAENQMKNGEALAKRAQLQFEAQIINESDLANTLAQYESQKAGERNAHNAYQSSLQSLQLLIRKPFDPQFAIAEGGLGLEAAALDSNQNLPYQIDELFALIDQRPDVQAALYSAQTAEHNLKAAKGALLPTLSMGASTGTVYSDNAKEITGVSFGDFQPIGRVQGSGEIVEAPEVLYQTQTSAFSDQLSNNLGNSVGINLSIPLYNNRQAYVRIQQAELELTRAQLNLEKTRMNAHNEIQTAWLQYENAKSQYFASRSAEKAQEKSIKLQRLRFEQGLTSQVDFWVSEFNYNNSVQTRIEAEFDYQFRRLILDYYANPSRLINTAYYE